MVFFMGEFKWYYPYFTKMLSNKTILSLEVEGFVNLQNKYNINYIRKVIEKKVGINEYIQGLC